MYNSTKHVTRIIASVVYIIVCLSVCDEVVSCIADVCNIIKYVFLKFCVNLTAKYVFLTFCITNLLFSTFKWFQYYVCTISLLKYFLNLFLLRISPCRISYVYKAGRSVCTFYLYSEEGLLRTGMVLQIYFEFWWIYQVQ